MNRLLRLYPAIWRDRYGAEFEALLADRPPGLRDRLDIARGALDARLRPQLSRADDGAGRRSWHPAVVGATVLGGALFVVAAWAVGSQDPAGLEYRDATITLLAAWIGALLLAVGPLRAISVAPGASPAARWLFPAALVAALLIVGPWPIVIYGYYLFLIICLATAIAMAKAEGPAWLLVVVATLVATSFNVQDDRAWLLVPFGLAWMLVGLLHAGRLGSRDERSGQPDLEVSAS
jgi:hypothetical protein